MDEIILKAFADGIVEALKDREQAFSFAAVDLGESHDSDGILHQQVKFYWDITLPWGSDHTNSVATVISIDCETSEVRIGYQPDSGCLSAQMATSAADWLAQEATRPL